jgi:hypothetical protein
VVFCVFITGIFGQNINLGREEVEIDSTKNEIEPFQLLNANFSLNEEYMSNFFDLGVGDSSYYTFNDNYISIQTYVTRGDTAEEAWRMEISKKKGHLHFYNVEHLTSNPEYPQMDGSFYSNLCILTHPGKQGKISSITAYRDSNIVGQQFYFSKQGYLEGVEEYLSGELIKSTYFYPEWEGASLMSIYDYLYSLPPEYYGKDTDNLNEELYVLAEIESFLLIDNFIETIGPLEKIDVQGESTQLDVENEWNRRVKTSINWFSEDLGKATLFDQSGNIYATGNVDQDGFAHGQWEFYKKTGKVKIKNFSKGKRFWR